MKKNIILTVTLRFFLASLRLTPPLYLCPHEALGMEKYLSYFTSQVCMTNKRTSNGYLKKLASVDFLKNELREIFTPKTSPKINFSGKFRISWSQNWNICTSFSTFLKELLTKCEIFRRPNSKIHAGQIVSIYKTKTSRHIKLLGTRYWQICRLNVGGGLRTKGSLKKTFTLQ